MNRLLGKLRSALGEPSVAAVEAPSQPTDNPEGDDRLHAPSFRLRYTGSLAKDEFTTRCAAVSPWYHTYLFDNGFEVHGDYDVGANIADFGFPDSMDGMEVLDLGAGAGWYSHFFAQKGASVAAVDARGYGDFDVYGSDYIDESLSRTPDAHERDPDGTVRSLYFSPVSRAMWVMREILRPNIRMYNARVYDVGSLFGGKRFDLVFMGALLLHLRDPIGALMAARSVCRGQLVASTPLMDSEEQTPVQIMPWTHIDRISWWLPNEAAFRHWFLAAGFSSVDVDGITGLRSDKEFRDKGRVVNPDQILRIGRATV